MVILAAFCTILLLRCCGGAPAAALESARAAALEQRRAEQRRENREALDAVLVAGGVLAELRDLARSDSADDRAALTEGQSRVGPVDCWILSSLPAGERNPGFWIDMCAS